MQQFERERESKKEDFEVNLAIRNDKQYMVLTTTFLYSVDCSLNYRSIRSWPLKHKNKSVNLNKYYRQDFLMSNQKRVHVFGYRKEIPIDEMFTFK